MSVEILTEYSFGVSKLKRGCTGSSESKLVKIPHRGNHMSRLIKVLQSDEIASHK